MRSREGEGHSETCRYTWHLKLSREVPAVLISRKRDFSVQVADSSVKLRVFVANAAEIAGSSSMQMQGGAVDLVSGMIYTGILFLDSHTSSQLLDLMYCA